MIAASSLGPPADVVIVGAGIVGLAHAAAALDAGSSVVVIERDLAAVGASIRNFGHICTTAQDGQVLAIARDARRTWLRVAADAGLWLRESGTVVVARAADEMAVLEEFAERRDGEVRLLGRDGVARHANLAADDVVGGALLPLDLRVDAREAVPAISAMLGARGVRFHWGVNVTGIEPGVVYTALGEQHGAEVIVAVGHDIDRLLPDVAADAGVERCRLHMLAVGTPGGGEYPAAVLTGTSMLRYDGLASCAAAADVRARLAVESPELLAHDVNLMFTQRPNGDVIVGDTHERAITHAPFRDEAVDELLLGHVRRLLGALAVRVTQRWIGVYASAPSPFLVATPMPGVTAVSVTSGIGMTTAFGLAGRVLDGLGAVSSISSTTFSNLSTGAPS